MNTVLITGSSSGYGLETARRFHIIALDAHAIRFNLRSKRRRLDVLLRERNRQRRH